jgi:anti-sigma factor RsiW
MKCAQGRKLFGAYWDDETTQAEREWLESHFAACPGCRKEYEEFWRALEWVGTLPRVEPAPDLAERVLARARRAVPAADRIPEAGLQWVPLTAAAALLLILGVLISPWVGLGPGPRMASREVPATVHEPELVPVRVPSLVSSGAGGRSSDLARRSSAERVAAVSDSLFDHSEDVEFILDPVTLHRGRATMTRVPAGAKAAQAVISF